MSGIAGIARSGMQMRVNRMLDKMAHRGPAGREVFEVDGVTLGRIYPAGAIGTVHGINQVQRVRDAAGPGHLAQAQVIACQLVLRRDPLGIAPLYYGWTPDGLLCFASEVKALLELTRAVHELPPGHLYSGEELGAYFHLTPQPLLPDQPEQIAQGLRRRLNDAVEQCLGHGEVGAWLSGGLDSSTLAALARPHVKRLHTFSVGLPGALDLEHARAVARFIDATHHEVSVTFGDMLTALPVVIYHLESFDAWLVRSSITNYLVAKAAAEYVPAVFSGEGGDELFAGYEYLKSLDRADLPAELIDIAGRLHNTALQRVDRSAAAHGTVAHVAFLDPHVIDYALRIPADLKLHQGIEKWILRQALTGALPDLVLNRPKAKFWEGAGVGELLAHYADERISPDDFKRERHLPDGSLLNSKEELLYYRIFHEHFGEFSDLTWLGRTKGTPVQNV
ncbi:MAG TPA: asparagine synthase-related protein [Anaerolineae bacterium]|nr:asparagine synthase-related protein [Anaerolineae bacterium]